MDVPIRLTSKAEPEFNEQGLKMITKKYIKQLCDEQGLYMTPHLNDKLYLHFKGFCAIQNLEDYINLKAIFLEHNCIKKIENLGMLKQIRCLYLQNNLITKMEGLEELTELVIVNLSHNQITRIEGLSTLVNLNTLDLSYNYVDKCEDAAGILECQSLANVDLSNNKIVYSEDLQDLFTGMKNLACLYLKNNPLIRDFPNYRKTLVSSMSTLKYLDDKPVFDLERRAAEAWKKGGREAEMEERAKFQEERRERDRQYALENREREEKARLRRKKELERIERECGENKEKLMKQKEDILKAGKYDSVSNSMLYQIDKELANVNEMLNFKEEKANEIVEKETTNMSKFQCLYKSVDKNGQEVYHGVTKEEVEKHREDKYAEWARKQEEEEEKEKGNARERKMEKRVEERENEEQEKEPSNFKWTEDLDSFLESLLEKHFFDFAKVYEEFNAVLTAHSKDRDWKAPETKLSEAELRKRWTAIELDLYRTNSGATGGKENIPPDGESKVPGDGEMGLATGEPVGKKVEEKSQFDELE